ncbi:MAG: polyphosphate kinase 2 family protein [Ancrocorticia sp.]|jgi:PPK2 family polyphosphate:nucleotide phosphotransferase|nr:polyphosphate kinase 2 family protein [Ancrocorticia sp.]MCI1896261.1 polyphosphate kinase 2 family protein [Ancrocorticia sp.]MCI1933159.1 polyphosphate kinase 2 family protein [Ancrocorticia sp.]MCI1963646.1 polyphosphate kinase 2 family protein [Ancrocorticia sp.]MCI2002765.1 polyphosphate kinase 2 family protein [Ancrocorticia sp.]
MATGFWKDNPAELLRVRKGFDLRTVDPDATPGTKKGREAGEDELEESAQELRELQEKLYAQSKVGGQLRMLVVLQAMDAAGKGGIVNHVFSHVEPYGLALTSFKAPTAEERAHDFLWRIEPHVPGPGMIGVFDRSHYEDVLIQRVRSFAPPGEIERRYGAISDFEKRIWDKGVKIVKIMLHISPQEQEKRLLARLDNPEKHWKYNTGDLNERLLWPAYMDAFQIAIERTHTEFAPWFVVPANAKWYARAAVQRIVISELSAMDLQWPVGDFDVERERQRVAQSADLRWP